MIVMCGLPASGKSTWIERNAGAIPVVCLDAIRADLNVKPSEDQTHVMQVAFDRAKGYLRNHQTFIWDATCLTRHIRHGIAQLGFDYDAFVNMVYLECDSLERGMRNRNREECKRVPDDVMDKMKDRLEPPAFDEAHEVTWIATSDNGFKFVE